MTIAQAWDPSTKWRGTRLDPDFRRPTVEEARAIFAGVGRWSATLAALTKPELDNRVIG